VPGVEALTAVQPGGEPQLQRGEPFHRDRHPVFQGLVRGFVFGAGHVQPGLIRQGGAELVDTVEPFLRCYFRFGDGFLRG